MYRRNYKGKMITSLVLVLVLGLSLGFAAFSNTLRITPQATVTPDSATFDIDFSTSNTSVVVNDVTPTLTGTGITAEAAEIDNSTSPTITNLSVNFTKPGQKAVYSFYAYNNGALLAYLNSINFLNATGKDSFISCEAVEEGTQYVEAACNGVEVSVKVGSLIVEATELDIVGHGLPVNTAEEVIVTIEYLEGATMADGAVNVNFGDITLVYTTLDGIAGTDDPNFDNQLRYKILNDNIAYADNIQSAYVGGVNGIDFGQVSSSTNGKGLYYTSTNTQDGGTTYYFRGDVDNNYVKFGKRDACMYDSEKVFHITSVENMTGVFAPSEAQCLSTNVCDAGTVLKDNYDIDYRYVTGIDDATCAYFGGTPKNEKATWEENAEDLYWRIVRINEDGSIRLVTDNVMGESAFNEDASVNPYSGYMYGWVNGQLADWSYEQANKNQKDSTIKTYLDNWYLNQSNLSTYASLMATNAGFCNDRSKAEKAGEWASWDAAWGYEDKGTIYGSAHRLVNFGTEYVAKENAQPQFACPNETRDLFTMNTSSEGNQALTYPIGLLTMDEVAYAGAAYATTNTSMYLNKRYEFWTMSPMFYNDGKAGIGMLVGDMAAYNTAADTTWGGIRPVINLAATVEFAGGNGTETNPYTIKTN